MIDYHDENNTYDEAAIRLQLDLARGNAPDLLVTTSVPDGAVYSEKGMLCDLYAFMEHDSELNRETVVPSVLRAYEENGGLYVLAPNFVLATVYGPKSILGDKERRSLKEFQELLKFIKEDLVPREYVLDSSMGETRSYIRITEAERLCLQSEDSAMYVTIP